MSEAAFSAAITSWHDFYLAAAGASAALLGQSPPRSGRTFVPEQASHSPT